MPWHIRIFCGLARSSVWWHEEHRLSRRLKSAYDALKLFPSGLGLSRSHQHVARWRLNESEKDE
jgi:hypothetical protein